MPKRTRCSANSGLLDGAWPQSDEVIPASRQAVMIRPIASRTAASDSSNSSAQVSESRSTPSISCVRSLRTDGDAIDAHRGVLGDAVDDRRHLGHHPAVQAPLATERAGVDGLETGLELPRGADERDHQVEVRRLVPDPGQQLELEGEQIRLADVAVAASIADHRVVLDRFEPVTAVEPAELVRAEVDGPVHDRARCEGAGDPQQRRRTCGSGTRPVRPGPRARAGAPHRGRR